MTNENLKESTTPSDSTLNDGLVAVTTQEEVGRITVYEYYGNAFIEFGTALKDPCTTISELSLLANKCNLILKFGIDQIEV